jgi:serine/threonine protein kinase
MISSVICNKYTVNALLGNGKFGVVYDGITKDNERVAIKVEQSESDYKNLKHEATVLNYLFYSGTRNIPKVYWFGQHLGFTCLVMSHFSCSLHDYILRKGTLNPNKLGSMMIKCIDVIESIHRYHILHRDIKPQNFMIKDGDLYMIDFGLSTAFVDDKGEHIMKKDTDNVIGSPKYISYYNHCGEPMSRRDDLISLGYMYMFMQNGKLPWDSIGSDTDINDPANVLRRNEKEFSNLNVDGPIKMYLKYCYELKYNDEPNYHILQELFIQSTNTVTTVI